MKNTAVQLTEKQRDALLLLIPVKSRQSRLLLDYLAQNKHTPTQEAIAASESRNLPDAVHRANQYLAQEGYAIACERPLQIDGRKKKSNQWLWSIYKVPEAPHNSVIDQSAEYSQIT